MPDIIEIAVPDRCEDRHFFNLTEIDDEWGNINTYCNYLSYVNGLWVNLEDELFEYDNYLIMQLQSGKIDAIKAYQLMNDKILQARVTSNTKMITWKQPILQKLLKEKIEKQKEEELRKKEEILKILKLEKASPPEMRQVKRKQFLNIPQYDKEIDQDNDGVLDTVDKCVSDPEDYDLYEDDDGCPEYSDSDGDGILDHIDTCPSLSEDFNNIEDTDGCPEIDQKTEINLNKLSLGRSLSKAEFQTVVSTRADRLISCIEKEVEINPNQKKFVVEVTIQNTGKLLNAKLISGSKVGNRCVFKALQGLTVEPFDGGNYTGKIPFELEEE